MVLKCAPVGLAAARGGGARVPPKVALPWYLTPEHKAWSRAVIARAGGRCETQGCGRGGRMFADHIVEIRDGGAKLDLGNGRALCGSCHGLKTSAARAARMARGVGV